MAEQEAVTNAEATAPASPPDEQAPDAVSGENPVKTPEPEKDAREYQAERQRQKIEELETRLSAAEARQTQPSFPAPVLDRQKFYDPLTGVFDFDGYDRAVNTRIEQAKLEAQAQAGLSARAEAERVRQEEKVLAKYPEIDPKSKDHDPDFYEAVAAAIDRTQRQGKSVDYVAIADKVRSLGAKQASKAAEAAETKVKEEQASKEAAGSLAPTTSSSAGQAAAELAEAEELRARSRSKGIAGTEALAERLKNLKG